jgi:3-oxoacyl-[acyl-carrier protein] reductase
MDMATYPELAGRVVLITGAARGIGAAMARAFAVQRCRLALCDLEVSATFTTALAQYTGQGSEARAYGCDVRKPGEVESLVKKVVEDSGTIDILVNNAGVCRDGVVWKLSDEDWGAVLGTNLNGSFHLIRSVAPHMRRQKSGRIINIASINGMRGKFGQSNYAASKAGVIALTKSVARELGGAGITVNAIAPGFIETDMTSDLSADVKSNALRETALGRLGNPEDIAAAALFLSSDGARHITGEVIKVDGGQYI